MEDIINDEVLGELEYQDVAWVGELETPVLNSEGNLTLVFHDVNKEGILDVQREAYKTYLQNEEKYKNSVTDYLLEHYKWVNEYFMRTVSGIDESFHKDVVTEKQLYQAMELWYLFICRDGSFGYAFGCCWDRDNGIAVLLSESEPHVISRTQLENLHKLNDPTVGLLVHDGKNAWKGLEVNKFIGKPENLEIELEGGVDEGITEAQQKAYADYLEKKEAHFASLTKLMLDIYVGDEKKANDMLNMGQKVVVGTCLPKSLYIDRDGNYGWTCYTDWDDDYVDILLSSETPHIMEKRGMSLVGDDDTIIDEEMGVFLDDDLGLRSTVIVRMAGNVMTLPFNIQIYGNKKSINEDMRNAFKMYVKFNETMWTRIPEVILAYYLQNYHNIEGRFDVPDALRKERVNTNNVMDLVDFTSLFLTEEGRIAWLCEFPTAEDGLAFEFTDDFIDLIPQTDIL